MHITQPTGSAEYGTANGICAAVLYFPITFISVMELVYRRTRKNTMVAK